MFIDKAIVISTENVINTRITTKFPSAGLPFTFVLNLSGRISYKLDFYVNLT
jgi:hypothetical protein